MTTVKQHSKPKKRRRNRQFRTFVARSTSKKTHRSITKKNNLFIQINNKKPRHAKVIDNLELKASLTSKSHSKNGPNMEIKKKAILKTNTNRQKRKVEKKNNKPSQKRISQKKKTEPTKKYTEEELKNHNLQTKKIKKSKKLKEGKYQKQRRKTTDAHTNNSTAQVRTKSKNKNIINIKKSSRTQSKTDKQKRIKKILQSHLDPVNNSTNIKETKGKSIPTIQQVNSSLKEIEILPDPELQVKRLINVINFLLSNFNKEITNFKKTKKLYLKKIQAKKESINFLKEAIDEGDREKEELRTKYQKAKKEFYEIFNCMEELLKCKNMELEECLSKKETHVTKGLKTKGKNKLGENTQSQTNELERIVNELRIDLETKNKKLDKLKKNKMALTIKIKDYQETLKSLEKGNQQKQKIIKKKNKSEEKLKKKNIELTNKIKKISTENKLIKNTLYPKGKTIKIPKELKLLSPRTELNFSKPKFIQFSPRHNERKELKKSKQLIKKKDLQIKSERLKFLEIISNLEKKLQTNELPFYKNQENSDSEITINHINKNQDQNQNKNINKNQNQNQNINKNKYSNKNKNLNNNPKINKNKNKNKNRDENKNININENKTNNQNNGNLNNNFINLKNKNVFKLDLSFTKNNEDEEKFKKYKDFDNTDNIKYKRDLKFDEKKKKNINHRDKSNEYNADKKEENQIIRIQSTLKSYYQAKHYQQRFTRAKVIEELIDTEREYISRLEQVRTDYLIPIGKKKWMKGNEIKLIKTYLEEILNLSKKFISKLEKRKKVKKSTNNNKNCLIGKIFLQLAPQLGIYSSFVNRYMNFLRDIEELKMKKIKFEHFLNGIKLSTERQLGLFDLLIAPVQHLPRCILLLNALIQHTPKKHPDYCNLEDAFIDINEKVNSINQRRKIFENIKKIFEINNKLKKAGKFILTENPIRRFIKSGEIIKINKNKPLEYNLILFNDLILIVKPQMGKVNSKEKEFYVLKKMYPIDGIGNIKNINFEKKLVKNQIQQLNKKEKDNKLFKNQNNVEIDIHDDNFEYNIKNENGLQGIGSIKNINLKKKTCINFDNNGYFSFQIWDSQNEIIFEEFHFNSQLKRDNWVRIINKVKLQYQQNSLNYSFNESTDNSSASDTYNNYLEDEIKNL
ncbi:protein tag-52-related [Anaeramoeba flamelloides]|uniref:Protein tag-52-related n=1 Tax=Anaeramoeba flamelloides TaxID=1746091 RepID=A0AAV7YQC1_9EUKA|nr:protein tag-52-related [Anaeramoeba flamelloides]